MCGRKSFLNIFCENPLSKPSRSCIILFVAGADVAQPVERILGKDEVHEFDSRHQLHMKPPSLIDSEGGFAIYCLFSEGTVLRGMGPFLLAQRTMYSLFIEK